MKKKGFTLIELLAVIVILAIIALILVPKISDLIFNVRRQAFRGTVNGIIDSADGYKTEFSFNHITGDMNYPVTFECDGTACKNSSNETLHFKGKAPTSGKVIINKDGILAENLTDGTFCGNGYKWDLRITVGCDGIDNEVTLAAGLYDDDDNLVADWNTLVNTYNLNVEKDYNWDDVEEDNQDGNTITYIMNNNSELSNGVKLVMPDTVTKIGDFAFNYSLLSYVIMSSNTESIGEYAFASSENLQEFIVPDSVTYMGKGACYYCTSIKDAIIGDGVANAIEEDTFGECYALENIVIGDSVPEVQDYAFSHMYDLKTLTLGNNLVSIAGRAFEYEDTVSVETLIIPDSVEYIGDAFRGYEKMTTLVIGSGLQTIGSGTFEYATSLTNLTIPSTVTSIGSRAFAGASSLTSLTIPSSVTSIDYEAFYETTSLETLVFEGGLDNIDLDSFGFSNSSNITSISIIGTGSTTISGGNGSFPNLETLVIGSGVIEISDYALGDAPNLVNLTLGNDLETIGDYFLYGSTSLTSLSIPNSVTSLGNICEDCTSLETLVIGNGVPSIDDINFNSMTSLNALVIGNSVTYIPDYTFENNKSLETVSLGNGITEIGERTFSECSNLTSVTLGDNVTKIDDYAFYETALSSIDLPNSLITIGNAAFSNTNISELILPNSIETIGDLAFADCSGISELQIPSSLKQIGEKAFYGSSITSIHIPSTVTYGTGYLAFGNSPYLETVVVDSTLSAGGNSFDNEHVKNLTINAGYIEEYNGYTNLVNLNIGSGVTEIGSDSFKDCPKLKNITFAEGIRYIESYVFVNDTSIENLTFPNSLTTIGSYVCDNCTNLTAITIGNGVSELDTYTFTNLSKLKNVTLGNGVEVIQNDAFNNSNNIETVTLGNNIVNISYAAFGVPTHLTTITFTNTSRNWYYEDNDYNEIEFSVANPSNNAALFKQTYEISRDWQRR